MVPADNRTRLAGLETEAVLASAQAKATVHYKEVHYQFNDNIFPLVIDPPRVIRSTASRWAGFSQGPEHL